MRTLALSMVMVVGVAAAGCGDDNGGGQDLATPIDQSAGVDDLAGSSSTDLSQVPDGGTISADAGGTGATCTTACDCMPGLACFGGSCVSGTKAVYCCNSAVCPANSLCQSNSGQYGACNGSVGMFDLAAFDHCPFIHCTTGAMQQCINAGCTQCVAGSAGMVCGK